MGVGCSSMMSCVEFTLFAFLDITLLYKICSKVRMENSCHLRQRATCSIAFIYLYTVGKGH